ncbi:MAG: CehA/McbA family metallohydrolase [Myxococcaceae bacterium]
MARQSSGRTGFAFFLALGVGFIGGMAAWWIPSQRAAKDAEAPAPQTEPAAATRTRRSTVQGAADTTPWLKGQLHAHTSASADSKTSPEDVVRWYEDHGYDFLVLTDHNQITRVPSSGSMRVIPGVELTQNLETCSPAPEAGKQCLLHVNALFVSDDAKLENFPPKDVDARAELFEKAIAQTDAMKGLAQINHPNMHWATDARLLAALGKKGAMFVEIANQSEDSDNAGDANHPSVESLWDQALTAGARLWGVATDDAHHYADADKIRAAGGQAFTGDRGFVMVRASNDPAQIRAALERGDFYSSTGVRLSRLEVKDGRLEIDVAAGNPGEHHFVFIGRGGEFLGETRGRSGRFDLDYAPAGYVRAVVTDQAGQKAWTQPVTVHGS